MRTPGGMWRQLPQSRCQEQTYIDVQIRLRSGPPNGPKMTTLKSVRVNFEPSDPNQNPQLGVLTVDGVELETSKGW